MGAISNLGELSSVGASYSSAAAAAPARLQAATPAVDQVHLSTIPSTTLAEQQLLDKNPPNLQAVLGDAVRNLRAAALQSSDPIEVAYLSGLADRFQRLEESGATQNPTS